LFSVAPDRRHKSIEILWFHTLTMIGSSGAADVLVHECSTNIIRA
jgi:hypothetical protein